MARIARGIVDLLTSLKLTIVCLALLMLLVVACTLAQVHLGTWGAVNLYMRSWLVWWHVPGTGLRAPHLPRRRAGRAGADGQPGRGPGRRLELSWKKAGIWVVHAGLILLVVGEFVTGVFQVDTQLAIEEGQTVNYVEHPRERSWPLIDTTDPAWDEVHTVPDSLLADGGLVPVPGTPVVLMVRRYWENAAALRGRPGRSSRSATMGVGASVARPARSGR